MGAHSPNNDKADRDPSSSGSEPADVRTWADKAESERDGSDLIQTVVDKVEAAVQSGRNGEDRTSNRRKRRKSGLSSSSGSTGNRSRSPHEKKHRNDSPQKAVSSRDRSRTKSGRSSKRGRGRSK